MELEGKQNKISAIYRQVNAHQEAVNDLDYLESIQTSNKPTSSLQTSSMFQPQPMPVDSVPSPSVSEANDLISFDDAVNTGFKLS